MQNRDGQTVASHVEFGLLDEFLLILGIFSVYFPIFWAIFGLSPIAGIYVWTSFALPCSSITHEEDLWGVGVCMGHTWENIRMGAYQEHAPLLTKIFDILVFSTNTFIFFNYTSIDL